LPYDQDYRIYESQSKVLIIRAKRRQTYVYAEGRAH
jgi:hypothetical protein